MYLPIQIRLWMSAYISRLCLSRRTWAKAGWNGSISLGGRPTISGSLPASRL